MKLRNFFFVSSLLLSTVSAGFIVVHDRGEHVMEKNSKCHVRSITVDGGSGSAPVKNTRTVLRMAQISQKDAQSGIDKVVKALQNNRRACDELGKPSVFLRQRFGLCLNRTKGSLNPMDYRKTCESN